jgi:1-phosphofructokinase
VDNSVTIFAPGPLLTVTVEQHADVEDLHVHPGGQGVWQARMIRLLGARVVVCTALGGETGTILATLLDGEGFEVRAVDRGSASGWYVHDRREGEREIVAANPGQPLDRHELDELYSLTLAEALRSSVCVLSGVEDPSVVAPDVYRRLASDLTNNDVKVVADLAGDHLTAVLEGGVTFLKVSHEELIAAGRASGDGTGALAKAARRLQKEGARSVLVSRSDQPALALLDDRLFQVEVPALEEADHRGAGDSMTAAVAAVLSRGGDLAEAVRTGAAAGAVNVTRHGLGTGQAETIAALVERVSLTPLEGGS